MRWIHRRGAIFRATLQPPDGTPGPGAVDHDRSALVRISDTFGWPAPLPDWVGLAIRLFEDDSAATEGEDRAGSYGCSRPHLDLLLASAATEPDLWCRLRPSRDVLACSFSSAVRYPIGGVDQVAVAVPTGDHPPTAIRALAESTGELAASPLRYRLDVAATRGAWHSLGTLVLTGGLPDDRALRFGPPAYGPRLITTTRRALYRSAQRWP